MKTGFCIGRGVLSVLLFPVATAWAQEPPSAASPPEATESALYGHIRPRQILEWPTIAETRTLLSDAGSRADLGVNERAWAALPQLELVAFEVTNALREPIVMRLEAAGRDLSAVTLPLAQDFASVDSPDIGHLIVDNPDQSQTMWLWSGASETAPGLVRFRGFEACEAQQQDEEAALALCARLTMPGAPPGVMWLTVQLNEGLQANFGVSLENPEDLPEAERQIRLLLSAENQASSRALAFLGLESIQERVVVRSEGSTVSVDVTLTAEETSGLARLLHEAIASEVQ